MAWLPDPVDDAVQRWLAAYDDAAPGGVEGLYVVGSAVLDDWTPHSDVDVVAVVADPSDIELVESLREGHRRAVAGPGPAVDGPFVAWGDLVVPPMAVQRPWVLDGELHVDGEAFEINPVTWFVLARHGVAVRGPAPAELGVHVDEVERRVWVRENLDTYWRGVGERLVAAVTADDREDGSDGAVLEWVVLGVSRMLYTYETGDVASKTAAGRWAAGRGPDFAPLIEAAVGVRHDPSTVSRRLLLDAAEYVERVVDLVLS